MSTGAEFTGRNQDAVPATAAALGSEAARAAFFDPAQTPGALELVAQFHGYDLADAEQAASAQTIFDLLQTDSILWGHYLRTMQLQEEHAQLSHERRVNAKTGLPNAVAFWEDFPRLVDHADENGLGIAVIFGDVNGFKTVNDELGYTVGDVLIRRVMSTLQRAMRGNALIYHISGDECVVILSDLPNVDDDVSVAMPPSGKHAVDDYPELQAESDLRIETHTNPQRAAAIRQRMRRRLHEQAFVGQFASYDLDFATGVAISAGAERKSAADLFVEANEDMKSDKAEIKRLLWLEKPLRRRAAKWAGEKLLKYARAYDSRQT